MTAPFGVFIKPSSAKGVLGVVLAKVGPGGLGGREVLESSRLIAEKQNALERQPQSLTRVDGI